MKRVLGLKPPSPKFVLMLMSIAVLAACGPQNSTQSKPLSSGKSQTANVQNETANVQNETANVQNGANGDQFVTNPSPAVAKIKIKPKVQQAGSNDDDGNDEQPLDTSTSNTGDEAESSTQDVISSIIWEIQASQDQRLPPPERKIPEGEDPSLAKDALEAAFALLAKASQPEISQEKFELPEKPENISRIALLVPLSGQHQKLGEELRQGAELALFSLANQDIELLVFDTAAGAKGEWAVRQAVAAKVDIIIGPLFTEAAIPARNVAKTNNIPMILLSNNSDIGRQGSWIMGYVPEQQLDVALAHSVSLGHTKFAVLAQDTPFGQRLTEHAQNRLKQFGIVPEDVRVLGADVLRDEERLKNAVKVFARYQPPDDDDAQMREINPPFESVVFAGDAAFALRTAPVLAYYDVASDRVSYLGNALWNQRQILTEPSLQAGVFATRPTVNDDGFNQKWSAVWQDRPGLLARLSFDAVAMVVVLLRTEDIDLANSLVSDSGFAGFSGAFRLLPDGGNVRAFELRQITNGMTKVIIAAPAKL